MEKDIPEDIREARDLLKKFEKSMDHLKRTRDLTDAFDILNGHIAANPASPYKDLIENLKSTYIQNLLKQLPKLKNLDYEEWLHYMFLLFDAVIKREISKATSENEILEKYFEDFISLWINEFLREVKELKGET